MQLLTSVEHLVLLILIFALSYLLWLHHQHEQEQPNKKDSLVQGGDPHVE